jgi:unsaturated rhamnogalacturonyl hydrolase
MSKNIILLFLMSFLTLSCTHKNETPDVSYLENPLDVVKLVGDKLIRDTPFRYCLVLANPGKQFNSMQTLDFTRTFGTGKSASAYAFTQLNSTEKMEQQIELEHSDGCRIWLNGKLIYDLPGKREAKLKKEERSVDMSFRLLLDLNKGMNNLLIESTTTGKQWLVSMQPPSLKGSVTGEAMPYPVIGLADIPEINSKIADLTNWLILGPLDKQLDDSEISTISNGEIRIGKMFHGINDQLVTWTIPKIEVLGDVIDPKEWGTNYNWNYHNGGVAWAMQLLSEATGEKKYNDYASNFCNFFINSKDFINFQVNTLYEFNSANSPFLKTPLLDYTLAPSNPFIYRLRKEKEFQNRDMYVSFIDSMIHYARYEQIRYPGLSAYTRTTPEKYTTWTDDMFMGIPFILQASQYTTNEELKKFFLNDAAQQVIDFSKITWDPDTNLFRHAAYSEKPEWKTIFWSRGNGWAIWAVSELLSVLPEDHPLYSDVLELYRKHVKALASLQGKNGLWHNVLVLPESREEVSGTAIFTLAMARGVRNGWIDEVTYKPVVLKAWEGIKTKIEPDGTIHNICYGTMCSNDVNYYLNRPFYDNDTHGVFAVIVAGIEVNKMLNGNL